MGVTGGLLATQTLTFLFTDIEGSTAMLRRLGAAYAELLSDHHRLIRAQLSAHDGREIDTQGDAFFAVFSVPSSCVTAAIEMQRALASHSWPGGEGLRVRMGIHSGEVSETAAGPVGLDVHGGHASRKPATAARYWFRRRRRRCFVTRCRRAPFSGTWACTG
jgi:class 3 adenylate cyclase